MLTGDVVDVFSARWDDGGRWEEIAWLARRFWIVAEGEADLAWSHLLLACGNFKRQGGTRLAPLLTGQPPPPATPAPRVRVPVGTGQHVLAAEDPESWTGLSTAVDGLGVATTTTVLSALWPDRHVIIDRLAVAIATALRVSSEGWASTAVAPDSTRVVDASWRTYSWYRPTVFAWAEQTGRQAGAVERALYELGRLVARRRERGARRTWRRYVEDVEAEISDAVQRASKDGA